MIAKYLVSSFNSLTKSDGIYLKNSYEFSHEISGLTIKDDEELVSFDVTALYPNVPIPVAMKNLQTWLEKQNLPKGKRELYLKMTKLCMDQTVFEFGGNYFKQVYDTSMGNPLSCFLANIFIANLELNLKDQPGFTRFWRRHVDDILVIIKKDHIDNFLKKLHETIKFTVEKERDNILPFLDLMLTRNNEKIEISVYRKPTNTHRYIPANSHTSYQHKLAAFNSIRGSLDKF